MTASFLHPREDRWEDVWYGNPVWDWGQRFQHRSPSDGVSLVAEIHRVHKASTTWVKHFFFVFTLHEYFLVLDVCPEKPRMPHPWRCSRPGWMRLWITWFSGRRVETRWSLRPLSQAILWFYDVEKNSCRSCRDTHAKKICKVPTATCNHVAL